MKQWYFVQEPLAPLENSHLASQDIDLAFVQEVETVRPCCRDILVDSALAPRVTMITKMTVLNNPAREKVQDQRLNRDLEQVLALVEKMMMTSVMTVAKIHDLQKDHVQCLGQDLACSALVIGNHHLDPVRDRGRPTKDLVSQDNVTNMRGYRFSL